MTRNRTKAMPPPTDWRKLPRKRHTRDLEALKVGESYLAPARLAITCRMWASRAMRVHPGRRYRTAALRDRSGRVQIYREA